MSILAWIEDQRRLKLLNAPKYTHPSSDGSKGLWTRCDHCGVILYIKHLKENQRVCFGCGYHLQMDSRERIEHLIDDNTWRPLDETLSPCDPLEFRDQRLYTERLKDAQERTGLQDAIQTGTGMLDGIPIALGVMDFHFMGGSMGSVVGEKITRLIEYAAQEGLTLVLVCASGGARMQEGIFSLMQMAKISSALQIYQSCANLLYISVLTSPTTGGVTASFAMLGDLIFAEPKALIGFAGRRVIEQTLQEELPNDFQTSEYLLHHGLLDLIVPRCFLKQALSETITLYRDAPFKRPGSLPYGVQNSLYFLTEEKARRRWDEWISYNSSKPDAASSTGGCGANSSQRQALIAQFLDNCMSGQRAPDLVADPTLTTTLRTWSLDTSSDTPYRDILMSFQAMFSVFPYASLDQPSVAVGTPSNNVSPVTFGLPSTNFLVNQPQQAISMVGEKQVTDGSKTAMYSQTLQGTERKRIAAREAGETVPTPHAGSSLAAENSLDLKSCFSNALAIGSQENIGWRAFYTNQRVSPKFRFVEHLWPTETGEGLDNSHTTEKKFFYKMILNGSGVWRENS